MGSLNSVLTNMGPRLANYGLPGIIGETVAMIGNARQASSVLQANQDLALRQLQERQRIEEGTQAEKTALEKQRLQEEGKTNDARRKAALRRAVARQKTLFSAQGLSPVDAGSSEAVLLGLYDESLADQAEEDRLNGLKSAALDQSLNATRQKNLLEFSQLGEQQHLYRILNGY